MPHQENRQWQRFNIRAPVRARLERPEGAAIFTGKTRDISAAGAYVMCTPPPPLGARLRVEVELPSVGQTLSMQGTVTRADADGFAIRFDEVLAALGG